MVATKDGIMTEKTSLEELSFEAALKELETIVDKLESGDVSLEESIAIYERWASLKNHCLNKLKSAQLKVEQIVLSQNGDVGVTAADADG